MILVLVLPVTLNPIFPQRVTEGGQLFNGQRLLIFQALFYFEIKTLLLLEEENYFNMV